MSLSHLSVLFLTGSSQLESSTVFSGFYAGLAVLVLLVLVLVYCGWVVFLAFQGKRIPRHPTWFYQTMPILAVLGIVAAGYLAFIGTNPADAICGPLGDCNAVQNSPYARLFGVLPLGILGLGGYFAILAIWWWGRTRTGGSTSVAPMLVFGMSLFGTLFSVYLTYLELWVIRAVCLWCLSSAVTIALMAVASLGPAMEGILDQDVGD